jgi:hypothetical protein
MQIDPSGNWVYTRFGLLEFNWPQVRHTGFGELPQTRDEPGDEFLTEHFSRDSRFAFFPDYRDQPAGQQYRGVVRPLHDPAAAAIELVTADPQVWLDQHPGTGHFWVRTRQGDEFEPSMWLTEFDGNGTRLRDIRDISDEPWHRRFLPDGTLLCWGSGPLQRVTIQGTGRSASGEVRGNPAGGIGEAVSRVLTSR